MKLVIVHYHLRPGGIRRVIELATPHLVRRLRIDSVMLVCGETRDPNWNNNFSRQLQPVPVDFFIEPAFNYFSEQKFSVAQITRRITATLQKIFIGLRNEKCVVWAHNLGIARNLLLTRELTRACDERGIPLLAHHHDWWFDNRWQRWPEVRRAGFRTLTAMAQAVFGSPHTRHISINHADWSILKSNLGSHAAWLPNLASRISDPPASRIREACRWLRSQLDHDHAPVWILPCRFLRRKNVAEALLLKCWLRPDAWLVTTGGVSSAEEQVYHDKFSAAVRKHHWQIRLGVLSGDESHKPSIPELLAASEAVLLTSVQEGFGLPFLEAAAAGRPLIARNLPNIAPDLAKFGFSFPQSYDEILIHPSLFDWASEQKRQQRMFKNWQRQMPEPVRAWAGQPIVLSLGKKLKPVPFSRLTLTAQIEILAQPVSESWELCAPLNPFLTEWQSRAQSGKLQVTPWPRHADRWLSGEAYARRFQEALQTQTPRQTTSRAALATQAKFIRLKLAARYLYPLLWSSDS